MKKIFKISLIFCFALAFLFTGIYLYNYIAGYVHASPTNPAIIVLFPYQTEALVSIGVSGLLFAVGLLVLKFSKS